MSDVSYPSGLPIPALQGSITVSASGETTKMDSGRSRHRQVSAKAHIVADVQWVLTEEEFSVFKNWFEVDLEDGTLKFDMNMFNFSVYVGAVFASPDYKIQRDDNVFTVTGQLILDKLDNSFPSFQISATDLSLCKMQIYMTAPDTQGQPFYYTIYRAVGPTNYYDPSNYSVIGTVQGTGSPVTFLDTDVVGGTTYYYQAKAQLIGDICPFTSSNIASQEIINTVLLAGQPVSWRENHVYWAGIGEAVYDLHRSSVSGFTPGSGTLLASNVTGQDYYDTDLATDTTYYYKVEAYPSCPGLSPVISNEISITTFGAISPTVTAVSGCEIDITFGAMGSGVTYDIYRSTDSSVALTSADLVVSGYSPTPLLNTTFQDTGLDQNTDYNYVVVAVQGGYMLDGLEAGARTAPTPPEWLWMVPSDTEVRLYWSLCEDATSYNLYRGANGFTPSPSTLIASGLTYPANSDLPGENNHIFYDDTTVANMASGNSYYYIIQAFTPNCSSYSNQIQVSSGTAQPYVPGGVFSLTADAVSSSEIDLSWTTVDGVGLTYSLYRGTTSGGETLLASGLSSTSYNDTGLTGSTTYYYKVRAITGGGYVESDEASATTGQTQTPPSAPFLSGYRHPYPSNQTTLNWTASSGTPPITYSIYTSTTSSSGPWTLVTSGLSVTTYTASFPSISYFYVKATNTNGSTNSNVQYY